MNRSARARESQMPAVSRQRQQSGSLRTSMKKEKEDDLALFLDMRKREKERNNLLFQNSEELDGSKPVNASTFSTSSSTPKRRTGVDDFLNSDNDKNDYDWLLTPPGTPLFPSLEMETQNTTMGQICTPKTRPSSILKSRLSGPHDHHPRNNMLPRPSVSSPGSLSSTIVSRKPLPSKTATSALRPTPSPTIRHPRSTTPTPRPTPSHNKPADPPRSSTPTTRHTVRSSTPTIRPPPRSSTPTPKPSSAKPTRPTSRAATPSRVSPATFAPAAAIKTARNMTPVRGISPSAKSRPWKPSEMPGFSLEAPPNLRTSSLANRPQSAARGRPGVPNGRASVEGSPGGRPRRQSCSPSRGRPPNTAAQNNRSSVPAMSRPHFKANDAVNPVAMGTKMVERVINMRRLVPSKLDEKASPISGKSSSPDTGFGRMLSKKSLDMAIRHMDIGRRTVPGNLRPLMTNIPASSMYSVRSGPARSRTVSMSDSPLATSSNASSEVSVNNCGFFFDKSEVRAHE